jgi:hypothetical protein
MNGVFNFYYTLFLSFLLELNFMHMPQQDHSGWPCGAMHAPEAQGSGTA